MSEEWTKCRKKPVVVSFREVKAPKEVIETREGKLEAYPEKDFIIKGVKGEIYPIKKDIFKETYDLVVEEKTKKTKIYKVTNDIEFGETLTAKQIFARMKSEDAFECTGCNEVYPDKEQALNCLHSKD